MSITIAMPQMGDDLFRKYMKGKYVSSLALEGARVKWIDCEDPEKIPEQLKDCDGLLLPGGADVDPALYNEERTEKCGKPHPVRDKAEPIILRAFLETGKPVLGICRGIQLINVFFGGTLFQDIKDNQKEKHMDFLSRGRSIHSVSVTPSTLLGDIFGKERLDVNSMHHQAIRTVGKGLIPCAFSDDGYIEAVEGEGYPFLVAVQWHPEHMTKKSLEQRKIFRAFVQKCKELK